MAVAMGAIAAHALRGQPHAASVQTAAHYQLIHSLLLLVLGIALHHRAVRWWAWAGGALLAGLLLFSGSIYLAHLGGVAGAEKLAPAGGISFMAAWVLAAGGALRRE